jgi:hypothetical protein
MNIQKHLVTLGMTAALGAAVPVGSAPAQAGCPDWNLSGERQITHGNGQNVTVSLQQSGSELSGSGTYKASSDGIARGSIEGNLLRMSVVFTAIGAAHQYEGVIDADGQVSGITFNDATPAAHAEWQADRPASCLQVQSQLAPASDSESAR